MSAHFQRLMPTSQLVSNSFVVARRIRDFHNAVPASVATRSGHDTTRSSARFFHSAPSSRDEERIHASPRKETIEYAITKTHITGENRAGRKQFADYDLSGRVFVATGGAQGLGLSMFEALADAGGKFYCLDRAAKPDKGWDEAQSRLLIEWGGSLQYRQQDVTDTAHLDETIRAIAEDNQRLDGFIAAAGVQQITPATDYKQEDVARMMAVNYTGVFMTASSAARQMMRYKCKGSICLIASMSGLVANKGLVSPMYNSSKAAVIQLARSLAMEWSPNFEEVPGLKETWEHENMMGRLADTAEFKSAPLFLMSTARSFMTAKNLVIDGGRTSW